MKRIRVKTDSYTHVKLLLIQLPYIPGYKQSLHFETPQLQFCCLLFLLPFTELMGTKFHGRRYPPFYVALLQHILWFTLDVLGSLLKHTAFVMCYRWCQIKHFFLLQICKLQGWAQITFCRYPLLGSQCSVTFGQRDYRSPWVPFLDERSVWR